MSDHDPGRPEGTAPVRDLAGARHGGTVVGIILVVIGVIMLVGRYVPWFDVFKLWPLIIVGVGIAQIVRPHGDVWIKRVAEGIGSVAVGLVLLGNTFGYIPWGVWVSMISLWPLLLVALGVELLGRGLGLGWVRALSNVVLLLGLLYGVFVLQPGTTGVWLSVPGVTRAGSPYAQSAPHDAAVREGSVTVKAGATRLKVGSGKDLAKISGTASKEAVPKLTTTVTSGKADVTVEEPSRRTVIVGVEERTLDLALDDQVTWKNVRLDVGAVEADADLRALTVDAVSVSVGASDMRLTLGARSPNVRVDVSGGAANIVIRVPADAAVALDSKSGLSNISVPSSFRRLSGMPLLGESSWAATGSGGPRITLTVQSGVSNLTVETY